MTQREKIAALAKEIGWTSIYLDPNPCVPPTGIRPGADTPFANHWGVTSELTPIPNFDLDLNATREIELWMQHTGCWSGYVGVLKKVCGGGVAKAISASASERFQAVLIHLNIGEHKNP
jgi:hypothetical protein